MNRGPTKSCRLVTNPYLQRPANFNGVPFIVADYYLPIEYAEFLLPTDPLVLHQEFFGAASNSLNALHTTVRFKDMRAFDGLNWYYLNNWSITWRIDDGAGNKDNRFGWKSDGTSLISRSGHDSDTVECARDVGATFNLNQAILLNLSTRIPVLTGNNVAIAGFIISGSGNKQVLVRALGPTLQDFGVTGTLADTTLELHNGSGAVLASNDNWKDTQQAVIDMTGLAPPNNLESASVQTFGPGKYTAILRGKNNTTRVGLVEIYDINKAFNAVLANISTRGFVDINQNVMIGGFISGNNPVKVVVRALGPTLSQFGVTGFLADPTLELHDAHGTTIAFNDN